MNDALKEEVQTAILALINSLRDTQAECHAGQGYSEWDAIIEDSVKKGVAALKAIDPEGTAAAASMQDYCSNLFKKRLAGVRVEVDEEMFPNRRQGPPPGSKVGKA
jgi:hypothetical protein